jgi:hypothetical protein
MKLIVGKISASVMGGQVEGLVCAYPGARTPIGAIGNYTKRKSCFLSGLYVIFFLIRLYILLGSAELLHQIS